MNTKGILIAILALGSITFTNAQQPAGYFFKEFTSGKVLLKFTSEIILDESQMILEQNVGNVITLVEYLQLLNLRCFSDQSVEMCQ